MIALLTKDLLSLKKTSLKILLVMGIYAFIFSAAGGLAFLSAFITIFSTLLIMNTFAYDELAKWDSYVLSLPVSKKEIVLSKYLLNIFLSIAGITVSFLLALITRKWDADLSTIVYCFFAGSLIISAVLIPLLIKFGTQKARIWIMLIFLLPGVGGALIKNLGLNLSGFNSISSSTAELLMAVFLPAALLIYAGSFFISCYIYQNKEI